MINKFLMKFTAGHAFFCHKEQQQFEMAFQMRREKVMNQAFFSF